MAAAEIPGGAGSSPLRVTSVDPGPGLHLRVDAGSPRPALRVELAAGRRIRVRLGDRVLLYARVAPYYRGVTMLRGEGAGPGTAPLGLLPPLGPREAASDRPPPAWFETWAWRYARWLGGRPGPLHAGDWRLTPGALVVGPKAAPPPGHRPVYAPGDDAAWFSGQPPGDVHFESWWLNGSAALWPLRAPSRPDAGRVKALRKLARAGILPPLLCLFVTGLDMYLLLDGHDRLQAATVEGVPAPLICLEPVRFMSYGVDPQREASVAALARSLAQSGQSPSTVAAVNRRLIALHTEGEWHARTRCFPLPGGAPAWDAAVAGRCDSTGPAAPAAPTAPPGATT